MKFLLLSFLSAFLMNHQDDTLNFGTDKLGVDWLVVNDGVMGGLSQSKLILTSESLILQGNISLENNGGFASVRSPYQELDFSSHRTVEIRYRSSGQNVALVFSLHRQWFRPNYKINFEETEGEWETKTIELRTAKEYRIARFTGEYMNDDLLGKIIRLGFITNSKKAGTFTFEVDYLSFN